MDKLEKKKIALEFIKNSSLFSCYKQFLDANTSYLHDYIYNPMLTLTEEEQATRLYESFYDYQIHNKNQKFIEFIKAKRESKIGDDHELLLSR